MKKCSRIFFLQYAPKDKQTDALCSAPPLSVCDQEYGLSIGRGSFNFTPGAWTHVKQTVSLNTPGTQDGEFTLEVNDQKVMQRSDVFYRDVAVAEVPPDGGDDDGGDGLGEDEPEDSGDDDSGDDDDDPPSDDAPSPSPPPPSPVPSTPDPGLPIVGPILGPLLNGLHVINSGNYLVVTPGSNSLSLSLKARDDSAPLLIAGGDSPMLYMPQVGTTSQTTPTMSTVTATVVAEAMTQTIMAQPTTTATVYVDGNQPVVSEAAFQTQSQDGPEPIQFTGLFFRYLSSFPAHR